MTPWPPAGVSSATLADSLAGQLAAAWAEIKLPSSLLFA
jgi:hypothetical protein